MNMDRRMKTNTRNGNIAGGHAAAAALGALLALLSTTAAHAEPPKAAAPVATVGAGVTPGPAGYSARALVGTADEALAAGRPGTAIVELERARLLAPRSTVVASHLAHARQIANLSPAPTRRLHSVARLLSGSDWSHLALTGLLLSAAGMVWLSWDTARRGRAAGLAIGGIAVATLSFLATGEVTPSREDAVVVVAAEPARIAPFPAAEPAFPLQEGAPVSVMRAHGDYVLISAAEGQGWLPRASVETILPGGAHGP